MIMIITYAFKFVVDHNKKCQILFKLSCKLVCKLRHYLIVAGNRQIPDQFAKFDQNWTQTMTIVTKLHFRFKQTNKQSFWTLSKSKMNDINSNLISHQQYYSLLQCFFLAILKNKLTTSLRLWESLENKCQWLILVIMSVS